jgi:hypothetical protein
MPLWTRAATDGEKNELLLAAFTTLAAATPEDDLASQALAFELYALCSGLLGLDAAKALRLSGKQS